MLVVWNSPSFSQLQDSKHHRRQRPTKRKKMPIAKAVRGPGWEYKIPFGRLRILRMALRLVGPMWLMLLIRRGLFCLLLDQIVGLLEEGRKTQVREDARKSIKLRGVWSWETGPIKEALLKLRRLNLLASTYKWANTMKTSAITRTTSKALRSSASQGLSRMLEK